MSVVPRAVRLPTSVLLAYGLPGMPIAFLLFPLFLFLRDRRLQARDHSHAQL